MNRELWKTIENYHFVMEVESYLCFQKIHVCTQEVLQQLRQFWHRVYASRDVGIAAEQISLRQNKQITKADSAEVNAGVSTKLTQDRVTIFAIFCIHEIFPYRWSTPDRHKICHGHRHDHRWAAMASAVATGGLPWVVSAGNLVSSSNLVLLRAISFEALAKS